MSHGYPWVIARLGICLVGGLVIALLTGDWEGGGGLDRSIDRTGLSDRADAHRDQWTQ